MHEAAGHRALAARRRDVGIAAGIEGLDIVAEGVEAVSHGVAPITEIEARGVVDVDADSVERIATLVADAAGDVVAGIGERTHAATCGDAVVVGLDLVVVGAVAVDRDIPVEQHVVGLGVLPAQRAGVVPGIGGIDRGARDRGQRRRRRGRAAVLLTDIVLVILEDAADLELMAFGRADRHLHQAGRDIVAGVADLGAGAVLVIALGAIDRAAEHVDVRIGPDTAEHRGHAAVLVAAVGAGHVDAPTLAGTHHVVDVLGAERNHATDRAGTVDVRGRAAHHVDAADQFRIEEERAVGVVASALIVLPRAVDHDGDAAEILQATDVDDGRRVIAALLKRDARDVIENVRHPVRLQALDLLQGDGADRRQRIDRALVGLGRHGRDGVERLHRHRANLRARIHRWRCGLLLRSRLRLPLGLLRPLGRRTRSRSIGDLRQTTFRQCRRE